MKAIKIDGAFPEYGTQQLSDAIAEGWVEYDRIKVGDRYVTYILRKGDPDVGKTSKSITNKTLTK